MLDLVVDQHHAQAGVAVYPGEGGDGCRASTAARETLPQTGRPVPDPASGRTSLACRISCWTIG
ncbi:hypothetical protein VTN02DRAFT_5443 [Thermoascus thermophilus]